MGVSDGACLDQRVLGLVWSGCRASGTRFGVPEFFPVSSRRDWGCPDFRRPAVRHCLLAHRWNQAQHDTNGSYVELRGTSHLIRYEFPTRHSAATLEVFGVCLEGSEFRVQGIGLLLQSRCFYRFVTNVDAWDDCSPVSRRNCFTGIDDLFAAHCSE